MSEAFAELAEGLSEAQLRWRPSVGAWGIAHCLDHLLATSRAYEPELRSALDRGRSRACSPRGAEELRPGPVGRWLMAASGPSTRERPIACPRILAPSKVPDGAVLERFLQSQRRLMDLLAAADEVDINAVSVRAPSSRLLRVSLGEALAMATGHAQRHLEQASRVRAHPRFPGAAA